MKRLIQIACCVVLALGAGTLAVRGQQAGIQQGGVAATFGYPRVAGLLR